MREKQRVLLLNLRSALVGKLHTQPFTIYNDATIDALLEAQPKTLSELSKVKGFPKDGKRIMGFGEAVIAVFTNCDQIQTIDVKTSGSDVSVGITLKPISAF